MEMYCTLHVPRITVTCLGANLPLLLTLLINYMIRRFMTRLRLHGTVLVIMSGMNIVK